MQERLHKALVVNAPPFFNMLWRIVQPLIPAATKERLFVLRNMKVCPLLFVHSVCMLGSAVAAAVHGGSDPHDQGDWCRLADSRLPLVQNGLTCTSVTGRRCMPSCWRRLMMRTSL